MFKIFPKKPFETIQKAINFVRATRVKTIDETKKAALAYLKGNRDGMNVAAMDKRDRQKYLMYCVQLLRQEGYSKYASFLKFRAAGYTDREMMKIFKMPLDHLKDVEKNVMDRTKIILERVRTGRIPIFTA